MFNKRCICWLKNEFWRYQDARYNDKNFKKKVVSYMFETNRMFVTFHFLWRVYWHWIFRDTSNHLKLSGNFMSHQVWHFKGSAFRPHSALVYSWLISEQAAIISPYSINWLFLIIEKEWVYCAVRTGCLNTFKFGVWLWTLNRRQTFAWAERDWSRVLGLDVANTGVLISP